MIRHSITYSVPYTFSMPGKGFIGVDAKVTVVLGKTDQSAYAVIVNLLAKVVDKLVLDTSDPLVTILCPSGVQHLAISRGFVLGADLRTNSEESIRETDIRTSMFLVSFRPSPEYFAEWLFGALNVLDIDVLGTEWFVSPTDTCQYDRD